MSDTGDTSRAAALLWQRRTAGRRGPKPRLTLDAIAHTGIEIADIDGLSAVTMHRVADSLGVTKMALYRYVPGKIELVALMVDLGFGEPPRLGAGGWRARLHAWSTEMFTRFCRHPWALEATVGSRAIGPHELDWWEQAVAALAGTGLDGAETLDVAATLAGHCRAIAAQHVAAADDRPEQAMVSSITDLLRGREDRFPSLVLALAPADGASARDNALDFGLARILDGVERFIGHRTGQRS